MLMEMVIDGIEFTENGDTADPADAALIGAAAGDQRAFADLYDLLAGRVFGLIMRILVDRSLSEEVLQEVFLEAWQQAASFDADRGHARSWLLTIAHRRAVDRVRAVHASRRRDLVAGVKELVAPPQPVDEEVQLLVEGSQAVRELAVLPEPQRQAIVLAYFGGYTHAEIAALIGAPLGTVKSRIRDGLSKLKLALEVRR